VRHKIKERQNRKGDFEPYIVVDVFMFNVDPPKIQAALPTGEGI
jgi:hypothetical protein